MGRSKVWRLLAVLAVFGLLAAACGDDDDDDDATEGGGGDGTEAAGDALVMGNLRPETGSLAFLGPPQIEGFNLAIEDINAAGGVLGADVEVVTGDEGDQAAQVTDAAQRMIGEGMTTVVGAAASGQSQEVIQTFLDEEILQCSPSNTAGDFTEQEADNAGFYIRTVPPDQFVAPIIADEVVADGAATAAILARADDYGEFLQGEAETALADAGAEVTASVTFDPEASTFDAEIDEATAGSPDAIVVISFDEGGPLISGLLEAGVTPDQLYGADGIFGPALPGFVDEADPNVIDDMKVIGAAGGDVEWHDRLNGVLPDDEQGNVIYGAQAYDCAIVMALAAEAAGTPSPTQQDAIDVSREGTECSTFEECKGLLEDGEDIDYNGPSGNIDLDDVGDPSEVRYTVAQFQDGELTVLSSQDVTVGEPELEAGEGGQATTSTTAAGGATTTTGG